MRLDKIKTRPRYFFEISLQTFADISLGRERGRWRESWGVARVRSKLSPWRCGRRKTRSAGRTSIYCSVWIIITIIGTAGVVSFFFLFPGCFFFFFLLPRSRPLRWGDSLGWVLLFCRRSVLIYRTIHTRTRLIRKCPSRESEINNNIVLHSDSLRADPQFLRLFLLCPVRLGSNTFPFENPHSLNRPTVKF